MATTTVRLSAEDEKILDRAAARYGGRSQALRAGLRFLDEDRKRRDAMHRFDEQWQAEFGPPDEADVQHVIDLYHLDDPRRRRSHLG